MTDFSKAIAQRFYYEAINRQDLDILEELLAQDFVWHEPYDPTALRGIEPTRVFLKEFFQAFPDYFVTIENLFSENEQVAVRWVATATHLGTFKDYPASHQPIVVPGISIMRLQAGKIAEFWSILDNFVMLAQMGAFGIIA